MCFVFVDSESSSFRLYRRGNKSCLGKIYVASPPVRTQVTDQGSTWGGNGFDIADGENPPFEGAYFIKKSFYKSITKVAISRVSRSFKEQRQIATPSTSYCYESGQGVGNAVIDFWSVKLSRFISCISLFSGSGI